MWNRFRLLKLDMILYPFEELEQAKSPGHQKQSPANDSSAGPGEVLQTSGPNQVVGRESRRAGIRSQNKKRPQALWWLGDASRGIRQFQRFSTRQEPGEAAWQR
jgi:hypothetical protein